MSQAQSLQARMLADSRMRDIRRRVEVIQKKLADLQEMGVPCAFCYSSVRNTGSIFTLGDKRITNVIERYRNEILCNLMEERHADQSEEGSSLQEIHLILPVLPAPLEELSRATLQSMIVGILKDLGIRWSDPRPVWWPADIPFVPPRSIPDNFCGNWLNALKSILKSVYGYFSYDINSYIASKLDSHSSNSRLNKLIPVERAPAVHVPRENTEEEGEGEEVEVYSEPEGEEEENYSDGDESDAENAQVDIYQQHQEQVTAQDSEHNVSQWPGQLAPSQDSDHEQQQAADDTTSEQQGSMVVPAPRVDHTPLPRPVAATAPPSTSSSGSSNRQISSFTVENILMNKQQSTSSLGSAGSSSHSPSSSSSAPSLPSPTPLPTSTCTGIGRSLSSSVVGVNWVSHPPVKYTKFTILSPAAKSGSGEAGQKRRKSGETPALSSKTEEIRDSPPVPTSLENSDLHHHHRRHDDVKRQSSSSSSSSSSQVSYTRHASSEYKPTPPPVQPAPPTSTTAVRVFPVTATTTSPTFKDPPVVSHIPLSSSTRLCTLPIVTSLQAPTSSDVEKKVVLSKNFPPSQHYVLLVPSSSAGLINGAHQPVAAAGSSPLMGVAQRKSNVSPPSSSSTGNPLARSGMKTVSFQSQPAVSSIASGNGKVDMSGGRLERPSLNSHGPPDSSNFRLIAPKHRSGPVEQSEGRGAGSRSRVQNRGAVQKPPKLRFHMTTVVTKQKQMPVKSSMTVESPLAMMDETREHGSVPSTSTSSSSASNTAPEVRDLPMESIIMCSPNVYSTNTAPRPHLPPSARPPSKSGRAEHKPPTNNYTTTTTAAPANVSQPGLVRSQSNTSIENVSVASDNIPAHAQQRAVARRLGLQNGDYRLQQVHRTGSDESLNASRQSAADKSPPTDQQSKEPVSTRHRGRTTRSYTRRKRELTFHLYEDPGTAFRAKRTCKE